MRYLGIEAFRGWPANWGQWGIIGGEKAPVYLGPAKG